jgi:hypothetical protein
MTSKEMMVAQQMKAVDIHRVWSLDGGPKARVADCAFDDKKTIVLLELMTEIKVLKYP